MDLKYLYEKTKALNYNRAERAGSNLSAKFIRCYINHIQITEENAKEHFHNLLKLSIAQSNDNKIKVLKDKKIDTSELEKDVEDYKKIITELGFDKEKSTSSVGHSILRTTGNIEKSLKPEVEKLSALIGRVYDEKLDNISALEAYIKSNFDFNNISGFTPNLVATILYANCPTAFPLINSNSDAGFKALGLKKYQAAKTAEEYKTLIEQMEWIFTPCERNNNLILDEEDKHNFGIIDRMFHVYNMGYRDFNEDALNVIYYGPPGTGKTHTVHEKLEFIKRMDKNIEVEYVQFHPSFTYEDFIEGIKPQGVKDGNIEFGLVNGVFKKFCIKAKNNPDKKYYFVVDEINRANLSAVFGETLSLLEKDYRHNPEAENKSNKNLIKTQYASMVSEDNAYEYINEEAYFGVPNNIYFIGMMNDVDKSIDTFDLALRRRFKWIRMDCDYEVIKNHTKRSPNGGRFNNIKAYAECAENLNNYISETLGLGKSYEFGHSFFMKIGVIAKREEITESNLSILFHEYLRPTLKEYLRAFYSETEIEKKGGKLDEAIKAFQKGLNHGNEGRTETK